MNTGTSHRAQRSKFTLVTLLVVFLCQFFISQISAAAQSADSQHSLDSQLSHHHSHVHEDDGFDGLETEEHGHDHHCHITCHPPIEASFGSSFYLADVSPELLISFENIGYAPPIPPPSA